MVCSEAGVASAADGSWVVGCSDVAGYSGVACVSSVGVLSAEGGVTSVFSGGVWFSCNSVICCSSWVICSFSASVSALFVFAWHPLRQRVRVIPMVIKIFFFIICSFLSIEDIMIDIVYQKTKKDIRGNLKD